VTTEGEGTGAGSVIRRVPTVDLTAGEIATIRDILWAAFGTGEDAMAESDWEHSLGGVHFILDLNGEIVAQAAVVERDIHIGERSFRTGYVEAVATAVAHQRRGFGTQVMREVNAYIEATFELGALGTGEQSFYERLGWFRWPGPSAARTADGVLQRTPDEDGYILVLRTPSTPTLDLDAVISCEMRAGDAW
jgi:aminoglycoside 2'-N-acetyltransferase I